MKDSEVSASAHGSQKPAPISTGHNLQNKYTIVKGKIIFESLLKDGRVN